MRYGFARITLLALPMMASLILEQLIGLTDVVFLGRVSETAVAASALGGVAFFLFAMLGFGYTVASQSQMALENGRKNPEGVGLVFTQSAYVLALFCLAFGILTAFSPWALNYLVNDEGVREATASYFVWRMAGLPFGFASTLIRAFLVATLRTRLLTASSIVMVVCNCALDYLLIFGAGPVPALGIVGAALASTLSEIVTLAFFCLCLRLQGDVRRYCLSRFTRVNPGLQKLLILRARWTLLQEAVVMTAWFLFFVWVESMGEEALAASNIVRTVSDLPWIIMHAFSATCGAIGANLVGENRSEDVSGVCHRGFALSLACVSPICLAMLLFPEEILGLFTSIESLRLASVASLTVMTVCFWSGVPGVFYSALYGFMGATRESLVIYVGAALLYGTAAFVLTRVASEVSTVWFSDGLYYYTLALLSAYFWRKRPWERLREATPVR